MVCEKPISEKTMPNKIEITGETQRIRSKPGELATTSLILAEQGAKIQWENNKVAQIMAELPEIRNLSACREIRSRLVSVQDIISEHERPVVEVLVDVMNKVVEYPQYLPNFERSDQQRYDHEVKEMLSWLRNEAQEIHQSEPAKAEFFKATAEFLFAFWSVAKHRVELSGKSVEPLMNSMIIAVASQAMTERVTEIEWKDRRIARLMRQLPEERTLPDFRETLNDLYAVQTIVSKNDQPVFKTLLDAFSTVVDYPTYYPMDFAAQQEYDAEVREYFAQLRVEAQKFYLTEPAKAEFFRATVDFGLELWKEVRLGMSRVEDERVNSGATDE